MPISACTTPSMTWWKKLRGGFTAFTARDGKGIIYNGAVIGLRHLDDRQNQEDRKSQASAGHPSCSAPCVRRRLPARVRTGPRRLVRAADGWLAAGGYRHHGQ